MDRDAGPGFLAGGGELGALMRGLDWSATPLGPPAAWPSALRSLVGIALGSSQPMLIVWGPELTTLYNDGYAAMCGARHPRALGRPFSELWLDVWDQVEPILSRAYAGESTSMDDGAFVMHRNGYPEEAHFTFGYTPVRDESGAVAGMFCACTETTQAVLAERRQRLADELLVLERPVGFGRVEEGHATLVRGADHVDAVPRIYRRPVPMAQRPPDTPLSPFHNVLVPVFNVYPLPYIVARADSIGMRA